MVVNMLDILSINYVSQRGGGGGVSQMLILADMGEGEVQDGPKLDDIIYEQPLLG